MCVFLVYRWESTHWDKQAIHLSPFVLNVQSNRKAIHLIICLPHTDLSICVQPEASTCLRCWVNKFSRHNYSNNHPPSPPPPPHYFYFLPTQSHSLFQLYLQRSLSFSCSLSTSHKCSGLICFYPVANDISFTWAGKPKPGLQSCRKRS